VSDFNPGEDRGLRLAAEHLLREARRLVPHEEGVLETSGKTHFDSESHTASVSFDTPYAVIQHEDLTFRHDTGRQAKYLEQPMNTEAEIMSALIQGEIRRQLS
jgi:Minor capsid protein